MDVVSDAVDGWSEWDRRFCVLCVADHGGDWEELCERLFDPSLYKQSGNGSNGDAFWSHVLDLRRRLDEAGLDAAAVAGERVTAKGVAAEARRKVFKRALSNNEPSVPMRRTPRVRLAQRAASGHWAGFPVSPQPFHDRLVRSCGIDRWIFEDATTTVADNLGAGIADVERDSAGDPAIVLAVRRAALTVAVFAQDVSDDSSGYLGAISQEMILDYARTDWPATGIDASVYWQDLLEYLVWEGYGLTHSVETDILAAAGAAAARDTCVAILAGLAREWEQARLHTPQVRRGSGPKRYGVCERARGGPLLGGRFGQPGALSSAACGRHYPRGVTDDLLLVWCRR